MKRVKTSEGLFYVHDASTVGKALARGEWWDEQIRPSIDAAAKACPGRWAIDLGANCGWFTCYLAKRFAGVLAVEAHRDNFSLLEANVACHGLRGKVRLIHGAAYDRNTFLTLATEEEAGFPPPSDLDKNPNGDSVAFVPVERNRLRVAAFPLDAHVPGPVGFIKVDVQGADLRALVGLQRTLRLWQPRVVFEWEPRLARLHGDEQEDCLRFFENVYYREPRHLGSLDYEVEPIESTVVPDGMA